MVLFIMLYKVVLTFQSEDETKMCDHSNEKLLSSTGIVIMLQLRGTAFIVGDTMEGTVSIQNILKYF